jgi:hypothetical protein
LLKSPRARAHWGFGGGFLTSRSGAFDINAEVRALITSEDLETDALARERLRHLRDVLNSKDLD